MSAEAVEAEPRPSLLEYRARFCGDFFDRVRRRPEGEHPATGVIARLDGRRDASWTGSRSPRYCPGRTFSISRSIAASGLAESPARSRRSSARACRRSLIVLIAGALYFKFASNPYVHGALRGCAAGALGLTIGNALRAELGRTQRLDSHRLACRHRGRRHVSADAAAAGARRLRRHRESCTSIAAAKGA